MPIDVATASPLRVFTNAETGVQTRVWPSHREGLYNVTLFDMDAEQTVPHARVGLELEAAIALALEWADLEE